MKRSTSAAEAEVSEGLLHPVVGYRKEKDG
jgi:hypothetical protein